jgi:hypothetical protein
MKRSPITIAVISLIAVQNSISQESHSRTPCVIAGGLGFVSLIGGMFSFGYLSDASKSNCITQEANQCGSAESDFKTGAAIGASSIATALIAAGIYFGFSCNDPINPTQQKVKK